MGDDASSGLRLNVNTGAGSDISQETGKPKTVLEYNRDEQDGVSGENGGGWTQGEHD